jgi:hypothetical protein
MSTVALVPQPPELTGAGGTGAAASRRRGHRSRTTPAEPKTPSGRNPQSTSAGDAPLAPTTVPDATTSAPARTTRVARSATAPVNARSTTREAPSSRSSVWTPSRPTTTRVLPGGREATGRASLTTATTGQVPVRGCAGVEVGWRPVADRPPLRLTRRGRAVVATLTILVFGAAILVLGLRAAGALTDGPRFSETTSVQVGAGQTLWSIAVETNPDQDPRIVIDEIVKINGLRTAGDVVPGQTLIVPKS